MKIWLLVGFGLASTLWGYIQYLLGQKRKLQEAIERREVDAKIKADNQAVSDALTKVQESTRDYATERADYLKRHPPGSS